MFPGPAQGAPSQYSSYQQGQGQQYGSYRTSQTGPSAQQQRPYGYEQASFLDVSPHIGLRVCQNITGSSVVTSSEVNQASSRPSSRMSFSDPCKVLKIAWTCSSPWSDSWFVHRQLTWSLVSPAAEAHVRSPLCVPGHGN